MVGDSETPKRPCAPPGERANLESFIRFSAIEQSYLPRQARRQAAKDPTPGLATFPSQKLASLATTHSHHEPRLLIPSDEVEPIGHGSNSDVAWNRLSNGNVSDQI